MEQQTIIALESHKSGSKVTVKDSEGYTITSKDPSELFEVLTYPYDDSIKVVWDMEAFLKPILALLPKELRAKLANGEKAFYNATKLYWGVGKGQMFGVNYKRHIKGNFYEEGQDETIYQLKTFFPNETVSSLADVKAKGELLMTTLKEMGLKPTRLTSCASIVSECILDKMYLPNLSDIPEEALECAEWSANYIREWRSTYRIGIFNSGEIFDFDKTAAYSSIMAQLPNLKYAEYINTDGEIPNDVYWGILHGEVTIDKEVSPIIHADGKAYKGRYEDYITTDDLDCIRRWDIGDFKADSGWFVRLKKEAYPFDYIMRKFYSFRGDNSLKDYLAKQLSLVVWGKMCERHGSQFGEFYFPIYSCMTTSKMRCALCDFIYENKLEDDLVSVIVDGLVATKKVDVPTKKKFGEWRLNPDSPAIVLSSPMQWVGDKKQCGVNVHQLLEEIKAHPMSKAWPGVALRFLEQDRQFHGFPKNGLDLLNKVYESKAFQ